MKISSYIYIISILYISFHATIMVCDTLGRLTMSQMATSLFIVVSLTMTSIVKLRIINSVGCLLFVIYGLNVNAYPVVISNELIVMINIYNLYMSSKSKK